MDIQHIVLPEAGKDYPHDWDELPDRFGSEEGLTRHTQMWPNPCTEAALHPAERPPRRGPVSAIRIERLFARIPRQEVRR
jgi:hypothetical protein